MIIVPTRANTKTIATRRAKRLRRSPGLKSSVRALLLLAPMFLLALVRALAFLLAPMFLLALVRALTAFLLALALPVFVTTCPLL